MNTVELALEVCASRFTCPVPLAVVAADFGNHHALVRGTPVPKTLCPSLCGDSALKPASWSCEEAGVIVSASLANSPNQIKLVQEVSVDAPAVSYTPIDSL